MAFKLTTLESTFVIIYMRSMWLNSHFMRCQIEISIDSSMPSVWKWCLANLEIVAITCVEWLQRKSLTVSQKLWIFQQQWLWIKWIHWNLSFELVQCIAFQFHIISNKRYPSSIPSHHFIPHTFESIERLYVNYSQTYCHSNTCIHLVRPPFSTQMCQRVYPVYAIALSCWCVSIEFTSK